MPTWFNGAGLTATDDVRPAAFVGSVIACCEADTVLAGHISGLARFAAPAIAMLQARLAPLGEERVNKALHLPVDGPVDLFDPGARLENKPSSQDAAGVVQGDPRGRGAQARPADIRGCLKPGMTHQWWTYDAVKTDLVRLDDARFWGTIFFCCKDSKFN